MRTRTCIGGDQCTGSGSESRNCSMELCPTSKHIKYMQAKDSVRNSAIQQELKLKIMTK